MNSKLSASKFIRNNKKQVWVLIIALALSFMTMYLINFLFMASEVSFRPMCLEQPKKVAYIDVNYDTFGISLEDYENLEEASAASKARKEKFMEDLKAYPGITDAYETQVLNSTYNGIAGGIAYPFPLVEADMIEPYLDHMGATLIEGRLPEGSGEILVDSKVLKNQECKVGDFFKEESYGKNFKIVGVLESDNFTTIGTPQGFNNTGWYIVVLCDEEHSDMSALVEDLGGKLTAWDELIDVNHWKDTYENEMVDVLDGMISGILIVITVFLTIAIVVAYVSFMRSRVNEYCLYSSIGYSRKAIYSMMMRELGMIFGISMVMGAVVSIVAMILLGENLLAYLGLSYQMFYPNQIVKIIAVFAAIVGVLQIPILATLYKIKTIDMIEE